MKPHATNLLWLMAVATKPEGQTPADWIAFCLDAAHEAEAAVRESPPTVRERRSIVSKLLQEIEQETRPKRLVGFCDPRQTDEEIAEAEAFEETTVEGQELDQLAHSAAATAFRCCMPQLINRRNTTAYIACVAVGMQHHYLDAKEAKSLMYTAQLALAAFRPRQRQRRSAA